MNEKQKHKIKHRALSQIKYYEKKKRTKYFYFNVMKTFSNFETFLM